MVKPFLKLANINQKSVWISNNLSKSFTKKPHQNHTKIESRRYKHSRSSFGRISVIIPARNEAKTIRRVIHECRKVKKRKTEILVIANGCTDTTAQIAREEGARVIEIQEKLGHDVGRAIGASFATGNILLFVDADMIIETNLLRPFVEKIQHGYDVALNSYPLKHTSYPPHPTVTAKYALNLILGRRDLKAASLTAVPFALTKSAARTIGYANLAIPPLAQTIAIDEGLKVGFGGYVNVGKRNPVRWRKSRHQKMNPVCSLIVGDHLEALAYLIHKKGQRAGLSDLNRKREQLSTPHSFQHIFHHVVKKIDEMLDRDYTGSFERPVQQVTTIIPARNEANSIGSVVVNARKAGTDSILVVDNGSSDKTAKVAKKYGANILSFPESLGHDVGRAVGAKTLIEQSHVVFTDGDLKIPAQKLKPFVDSVQNGIDIALNDLNQLIPKHRQFDSVSVMKRFLNIALNHPEFGICSLTAVPNGLSHQAVQTIGAENLAIPPLAYVIGVQRNLVVKPVHAVDVVKHNKIRPVIHKAPGRPMVKLIMGDHVEAIAFLQSQLGVRGLFPDTMRRRDLLEKYIKQSVITADLQPAFKLMLADTNSLNNDVKDSVPPTALNEPQ